MPEAGQLVNAVGILLGTQAIAKLVDALSLGIGGLAAPWQLARCTTAEMDAQEVRLRRQLALRAIEIQGEQQLAELRATLSSKALPPTSNKQSDDDEIHVEVGELVEVDTLPSTPLTVRAEARFSYQEAKRQLNIEQIANYAYDALPLEVSAEPTDADWIARFFDIAKDVSQKEAQERWGKLLAGEVAQPGKFSLRTLDILRNLSTEEARLFKRICSMTSNKGHIFYELAESASLLNIQEALRLEAAGLITRELHWYMKSDQNKPFVSLMRIADTQLELVGEGPIDWDLPIHALTPAAMELSSLEQPKASQDYLASFIRLATNVGIKVNIVNG